MVKGDTAGVVGICGGMCSCVCACAGLWLKCVGDQVSLSVAMTTSSMDKAIASVVSPVVPADKSSAACKCSARWVDEPCIVASIHQYEFSDCLLCIGCYTNQPSQRDHICTGHCGGYLFPDASPEDISTLFGGRTKTILRDPKTVDGLFATYMKSHESAPAALKEKFDWGLQRMLKLNRGALVDMLLSKDMEAPFKPK